jgi:Fe-S-cluster-containing dehydrogenase component/formate-dependent nitrite reductase membrane component NrfD
MKWAKVIDQERCIGCHACTVACKAEHGVPVGVTRTFVKQVEVGTFPNVGRHFQVTRCNQCDNPPCVHICPVGAMFQRPDGIVDFDRDVCIGCKACIAACPYDAIYIDPESESAAKCNFCAHRIDRGMEPACVAVCPERAIIVGDIEDRTSEVSRILARRRVDVRRPEKGTRPKVFYIGASEFTLKPGMAPLSPSFSEIPAAAGDAHRAGDPRSSVAAALISYDVPKKAPWGWPVAVYTWTKSVAAGAYLVPAAMSLAGVPVTPRWQTISTLVALAFLAVTAGLLVADLTHPLRFLRTLTRPQWRSWLARGSYIVTAYGTLLAASLLGGPTAWLALRWPGCLLAVMAAIYTAFLFAQAKGRDLWQNPLLPLHLAAQAVFAGAAALLVAGVPLPGLRVWLLAGVAAHALALLSEWFVPHATHHGARAFRWKVSGRLGRMYWLGALLVLAAVVAPPLGLAGLLLFEFAYVHAAQVVPQT